MAEVQFISCAFLTDDLAISEKSNSNDRQITAVSLGSINDKIDCPQQ
jgi:hypothetical protein